MSKIRIAFIKFAGLSAGGTERWLQMMAANLPKNEFKIDYYYCDSCQYVGSGYKHSDTNQNRLKYMLVHNINLIKFKIGKKDITKPTHDWINTDFWEIFDEKKYDLVQTAKAGPKEYPYYLINLPIIEFISLNAGVDFSSNIAWSIHLSQWQRIRWHKKGGNIQRSSIIPIPASPPSSNQNLREKLNIPDNAIIAGFHQRNDDNIFSPIPLEAFSKLNNNNYHFIIMGGGEKYKEQAKELGIKNIHFLNHCGSDEEISQFLNTLDIFAHGRKDGETFGTVFAEAMMHGLPCLSHWSPIANAQQETMSTGGLFAKDLNDYTKKLKILFEDINLIKKLALNGKKYAQENYSIKSCINKLSNIYRNIIEEKRRGLFKTNKYQNENLLKFKNSRIVKYICNPYNIFKKLKEKTL